MLSLIRAELLRARSRRLLRWAMFSLAGVALLASGVTFFQNEKIDPAVAQIQVTYEAKMRSCFERFGEVLYNPDDPRRGDPEVVECRSIIESRPSGPYVETFRFYQVDDFFLGFTPALFAIMLMFGASFFGGDWSSRSITQALTFEPRRLRLLTAKAVAIAVTAGVVLFAFLSLLFVLLAIVAVFRGTFVGFSFATTLATMGRLAGIGSVIAVFGATLASVTRSTGGTFGIAFAYLAVVEPFVVGWKPWVGRWLFTPNGIAVVSAEPIVEVPNDGGMAVHFSQGHLWQSALVLLGLTLLINSIAAAIFRRREIG